MAAYRDKPLRKKLQDRFGWLQEWSFLCKSSNEKHLDLNNPPFRSVLFFLPGFHCWSCCVKKNALPLIDLEFEECHLFFYSYRFELSLLPHLHLRPKQEALDNPTPCQYTANEITVKYLPFHPVQYLLDIPVIQEKSILKENSKNKIEKSFNGHAE